MEKSQRMRFTTKDDICLLREVAERKPFKDVTQWNIIQQHLAIHTSKCYSIRTIKEHVDHLLKLLVKNDLTNLRKSCTEKQYEEKEQLLKKIKFMWGEYKSANTHLQRRRTKINNDAISTIKPEIEYDGTLDEEDSFLQEQEELPTTTTLSLSSPSTLGSRPTSDSIINRRPKKQLLQTLSKENLRWKIFIKRKALLLKEKKFSLEDRRLKLEEEKFELERKVRESRLAIEIKERENNILISQQQQNIINFFMQNFKKD